MAPEFRIAIFGFLTAFVWEMWQMPFYDQSGLNFTDMVKGCSLGSFGDAGLMVFAYYTAGKLAGTRHWLIRPRKTAIAVYLAAGLLITFGVEQMAIRSEIGWEYDKLMPREPLFGTGLVPLVMWIFVPLVTLWLARLPLSEPD